MTDATHRPARNKIVVWDLPTRVFHWLLVSCFVLAWLTSEDNRFLHVHVFAGYLMLGLLVFRLAWGFAGPRYARFGDFVHGWDNVRDYLRSLLQGRPQPFVGHNPAGGWAIIGMLLMGFVVTLSGIVVLGMEEGHGPLRGWMSPASAGVFRELHETGAGLFLALVGLHLLGVVVGALAHRENLVLAMITGRKWVEDIDTGVRHHSLLGAALLGLASMAAADYFAGYWLHGEEQAYQPFEGRPLPQSDTWNTECGDCHLAYHPTLLPARSWNKLLEQQHDHFGEDLDLDPDTLAELRAFANRYAAESGIDEPAYKINRSIPRDQTPLRITDTPYWRHKHEDIDAAVWRNPKVAGKSDCAACHLDAEQGTFEDSDMRLP